MLHKYKIQQRDFVLLIDESSKFDVFGAKDINQSLLTIFDEHIQANDRICLIKYGKEEHASKIFSLVVKSKN